MTRINYGKHMPICEYCGKEYHPKRHYKPYRFCGKKCASLAREHKKHKLHMRSSSKRCENCQELFWRPIGQKRMNRARFCSRICAKRWQSANHVQHPDVQIREKLAVAVCSLLVRALRHKGVNKTTDLVTSLGYTPLALKKHLEKQFDPNMSWNNYGKYGWHIDHIKPISTFPIDADIKEINALSNLRPLWGSVNCSRKNGL